ncbi:MAG: O-antigen ligase family protein [Candidatus Omnitrophota bacterium]
MFKFKDKNQTGRAAIIFLFLILVSFSAVFARITNLPTLLPVLGIIAALVGIIITFINTDFALIVLIFSMLLSPEIPVAQLPERSVVIRIDDILLIFIFFTWFAKMAINNQLGVLRKSPVNRPLLIYILISVVFTFLAISFGIGKAKFNTAFFYIIKYTEYLMLYFFVANNMHELGQYRKFLFFFLLVCFIVCIYGYTQIASGTWRVTAPFEGERPEPNTLAGYLLIILAIIAGLFLHAKTLPWKIFLAASCVFIFPVFVYTLSRGGYVGFIVMYLALIFFSKKKKIFLSGLLVCLIILSPLILPTEVITRVRKTFVGTKRYEVLGTSIALEESAAARLETWEYVGEVFSKSPVFGNGVTGIEFVDTQYGRILGELGLIGMAVFLWLAYALFKNSLKIYHNCEDWMIQGISLGFLVSLIALLVMSLGANVFIIVRIMEPFWFIAAMVLMSPEIIKERKPQEVLGT